MLEASCGNCVSWTPAPPAPGAEASKTPDIVLGSYVCKRGLEPEPGTPYCSRYEATADFVNRIVRGLIAEKPLVMPIPIPGETARVARAGRRS